ncbi:uncharacterized protein IWZ02DRAFT_153852 [Phyllosticta citriasiana]|uniref:uncharacterized protein n=1 Tax=Phyllosticta citriasiana TaxID=595635 RepID=UPI0030FDCEEA
MSRHVKLFVALTGTAVFFWAKLFCRYRICIWWMPCWPVWPASRPGAASGQVVVRRWHARPSVRIRVQHVRPSEGRESHQPPGKWRREGGAGRRGISGVGCRRQPAARQRRQTDGKWGRRVCRDE